jgi:hypothetical protein
MAEEAAYLMEARNQKKERKRLDSHCSLEGTPPVT